MTVDSLYAGADLPDPLVVTWSRHAAALVGIGLGLPEAILLWPEAPLGAARAWHWVGLPHDGQGQAAWEGGMSAAEAPNGEAVLIAAQDIEMLADVAWLLHGVAVMLPALSYG